MIRLARQYIDALQIRLFLIDEYLRTRKTKNVGSSLLRAILRNPSSAEDWVNLLRFLDPDEELLVIDIGTNVGAFTTEILRYFPKARSICFEPCAEPFQTLISRFADDSRVECHQCAISSEHQTREIYVQTGASFYNSFHRYQNDANRFYDIDYQDVEEVECRRLDEFDLAREGKVLLKVDTQGHEVEVLRGAGPVLASVDVALHRGLLRQRVRRVRSFVPRGGRNPAGPRPVPDHLPGIWREGVELSLRKGRGFCQERATQQCVFS